MTDNVETPEVTGATQNDATAVTEQPQEQQGEQQAAPNVLNEQGDETKAPPGGWPEDWRDRYAKGDEKLLKQLGRYASPEAALDALFAAQKRISQGDLGVKKPGKDAKPEELAAYREAMGVPEAPDAYFEKLPNGLVIGDDDKPLFDKFAAMMHEENVPASAMHKVVDWYYKEVIEEGEQARYNADREARQRTEDELRQEYGPEYRAHINGIQNLLNSLPDGAGEILASAQTADGISLFNNPAVVRAMVHLVNEINPTAAVIPGGTNMQGIEDRLNQLAEMQRTDPKKYFSDEIQAEELRLMQAKEKLQSRA